MGFLVVLLESAIRNCKPGRDRWTWVLDMANYDSRNSPKLEITLRVLQLVANHYPERLNKVFIVDAPMLFWVLFKAVSPFLDPVTRAKIDFVYSKDVPAAEAAAAAAAAGKGGEAAAAAADTPAARFLPFAEHWRRPFDKAAAFDGLAKLGWPL